jgi:hypothetical protein
MRIESTRGRVGRGRVSRDTGDGKDHRRDAHAQPTQPLE